MEKKKIASKKQTTKIRTSNKKSATKKSTPKAENKKITSKEEWVTIGAIVGSIIFTPKEIEQSKKNGIDLMLVLKNIQEKTRK